jgi:hypothetical protein
MQKIRGNLGRRQEFVKRRKRDEKKRKIFPAGKREKFNFPPLALSKCVLALAWWPSLKS